jgi:hypothetical protein
MTGLIFVRFSKPKAKIIYAQKVVIAVHNGVSFGSKQDLTMQKLFS